MEYQTISENGKVKFVVLPVEEFGKIMERLQDESDLRDIHEAPSQPLYEQDEAEAYIFMNPVKRERLDKGWTQEDLANRIWGETGYCGKMGTTGCCLSKSNQGETG